MNIAVTKTFANFINKTAKELKFKCHAEVVALPASAYSFCTGVDSFDGEVDYDCTTGTFRVIEITYPYNFYANRRFLTTFGLTREVNWRKVETADQLKLMLKDMLEI